MTTSFALHATFYLGDGLDYNAMDAMTHQLMQHLLDVEHESAGIVGDPAVSLDAGASTVEVELVVTAMSNLDAHRLATEAVNGAFHRTVEERTSELLPA